MPVPDAAEARTAKPGAALGMKHGGPSGETLRGAVSRTPRGPVPRFIP
jgi:hypothetical protein